MRLPRRVKRAWDELIGRGEAPVYVVDVASMDAATAKQLAAKTGATVIMTPNVEGIKALNRSNEPLGDGQASFLGSGTHEEFVEQKREDDGTAPWYKRIIGLGQEDL